jgi:hypothetical protein
LEKGLQYLSGDAGRELLLAMHLAGVRLVVEGVWMKGLVEEITGNQPIDAPMGQSRKKKVPADPCSGSRRNLVGDPGHSSSEVQLLRLRPRPSDMSFTSSDL